MRYTCNDYNELMFTEGKSCSVGIFGEDIFAICVFVAEGHNCYHNSYYKITKEEFDSYPDNAEPLFERYCHGKQSFLCSDYMGKSHHTYGFEL